MKANISRLISLLLSASISLCWVGGIEGAEQLNRRELAPIDNEIETQYAVLQHDLRQRASIAQHASQTFHPEALIHSSDRDPADIVMRRTAALLADLMQTDTALQLAPLEKELEQLRKSGVEISTSNTAARKELFSQTCKLRRRIALSNPLLNFDKILFIKRHRSIFDHMCDQFYGITARPGGGLYVLENPFGQEPRLRDILADSVVQTGRLKGQKLFGGNGARSRLSYDGVYRLNGDDTTGGSFLSPSLSYDGKQILFAYVECTGSKDQVFHTDASRGHWAEGRCYHLFKVNVDGSELEQLTDGTWNDFDPCWLPNGRIAFISERRGGYLRCGRACPLYNLYDMAADGSGINLLSIHDSNEWNPSVTHDGRIVWTRWDYVDRHGCAAHFPWITRLDGTDPRALHGNFAPRPSRPDMELNVRAIPGSSKYIATATPHHGQAFGSLVIVDPNVEDDDAMGPVKRFTPDVAFPESQGGREVYGTAWPLSENYHLCVYDAGMTGARTQLTPGRYGIYLVDAFGNKELIYRDPQIGCLSPMPLRPTSKPPINATPTVAGDKKAVSPGATGEGVMAVVNIFDTLKPWPTESKIKEIRIYQLLPCSVPSGGGAPHQTGQRIAEAQDSIVPTRWVLGTVPVEADGSAHFKVPAYRELFFQLVDERGMAVQSMRSGTAVRDGEKLVCQGCHEPKHKTAIKSATMPLALLREPSVPKPDVDGSNPFSYPRLVQPVLDRNCTECHQKNPKSPNLARLPIQNKWYASYNSLIKYAFTSYGAKNGWSDPLWYRTNPGKFGAHASKLVQLLDKGHYDVKLNQEDFHRLTLWMDSASLFYGVFEKEPGEAQLRGEVVSATLE